MEKKSIVRCLLPRRYRSPLIFEIGQSEQRLVVHPSILNHFVQHQQHDHRYTEAGGQLFATFSEKEVNICTVTGPRDSDRRSRYLYLPCRREEQREIDEMHENGLHFVGDWHTHPEPIPTPSASDIRTIKEAVSMSRHYLHGFVMVIVGNGAFPNALHVSINTADSHVRLVVAKCKEITRV